MERNRHAQLLLVLLVCLFTLVFLPFLCRRGSREYCLDAGPG